MDLPLNSSISVEVKGKASVKSKCNNLEAKKQRVCFVKAKIMSNNVYRC